MTTWSGSPLLPDPLGPGSAVIVLGVASALAWGAGDFGGGMLARRVPLLGLVLGTQLTGVVLALALGLARREAAPGPGDLAWSAAAGVVGVIGITSLYRGLAVGRMGVVAPTTGALAAVIPVLAGFALQGVPRPAVIAGIAAAIVAVVLVTRAPAHGEDRPTGLGWALLSGAMLGSFNVFVGQLSGESAFLPLVVIRVVQALALCVLIVAWRQPWRVDRAVLPRLLLVGALDMGGNATFILATQSGQLAVAAVLSSLYPVTTVVLAIAILRERLTRSHLAGIALTAVAVSLIGLGSAATL